MVETINAATTVFGRHMEIDLNSFELPQNIRQSATNKANEAIVAQNKEILEAYPNDNSSGLDATISGMLKGIKYLENEYNNENE